MRSALLALLFLTSALFARGQYQLSGTVTSAEEPLPAANVTILNENTGCSTQPDGTYSLALKAGTYRVSASFIGMQPQVKEVSINGNTELNFYLQEENSTLDEVVVSGTLKPVLRSESPVSVEVYTKSFFNKNPTPNLYEAVQNINGVRPQLNCNVCNTGDIHINGLEGPYTMVLIDGMPIVSGLSTVYGLMGIPNSMIERVEVVKGPASSLYGSEAVGGLINVITKNPQYAPTFSADVFTTSWLETNADLAFKTSLNENHSVLTGLNLFNYSTPIDNNGDNFTDVTLQKRASLFQKWSLGKKGQIFELAGRFFYENRWGGEMQWEPKFRGTDKVYGESIITRRWELTGRYQLPVKEKFMLAFSFNDHFQDSFYGDMAYLGDQKIAFTQMTWDKKLGRHDLLAGAALRYNFYNDNTSATAQASQFLMPGLFLQNDMSLSDEQNLLLGLRYDYHTDHGTILTPRMAYKWSFGSYNTLRLNAGTGFRVVNLFTEEHAALTGARQVLITENLNPEQSYNINLNYVKKWYLNSGIYLAADFSSWYTHFTNQIIPDYDTDPNLIIYDNLKGYSVSRGISANIDISFPLGLSGRMGASYLDVFSLENREAGLNDKLRPVLTERWTGTWALSYAWAKTNLTFDYTGNLYGPMRLPVLGPRDPRPEYSPWWSIQNLQITWAPDQKNWEIYGGVKNLLNYTPPANSIARAHDPFDRNVQFDSEGNPVATPDNPYALTFDPSYVFAPNQGIRGFLGVRYRFEGR